MKYETINKIEVLDTGELFLGLEKQGQFIYQHIYREATGVYWDKDRIGFKSTLMKEKSCSEWFKHIVSVVRSGLGVDLKLGSSVVWLNIPERQRKEIQNITLSSYLKNQ